ncbi:MAG: hypothetical protein K8R76_05080 [Candidatus Aegiribacteria sp.]|nr:hypothetical protein [Candidatus Aegiribacteria sp.]
MKYTFFLFTVILISTVSAGEMNITWESPVSRPVVKESPFGEYFYIPGATNCGIPGDPSLPVFPVSILLPADAIVDSVTVIHFDEITLPSSYDIKPVQAGVPLSKPELFSPTSRNPEAYRETPDYQRVIPGEQGGLMGNNILNMRIFPVFWDPVSSRATFTRSITMRIYYHSGNIHVSPIRRGITGLKVMENLLERTVLNADQIALSNVLLVPAKDLPWGEYLIVTRDSLVSVFESLAQYKTMNGIPASIVTMEYIEFTYTGVDAAQKLRFFLRDIYDDSPPTYVLLGGDTPLVPHRNCWATAEGYVGDPAADIYFQDMNDINVGTDLWDANGNGIWGEIDGDIMDYHPDYFIGRASVENSSQADIFVNKIITYENPSLEDSRDTDPWQTSMGFTTGILWSSPYCPGSAGKEKVDTLYTPAVWQPVIKLYESAGTQSYTLSMEMLNQGMNLVNHAGHGSQSGVSIGVGSLNSSDFTGLTNISDQGRVSIWNTMACNSGGFDMGNCLAEAWIRSPGGGGFCMMNTRYGWGEPSEPGNQWSELVDQEFFANFFTEDMYHLGVAHAMAWDEFIPLIPTDTHYDWIAKSITLFGDPELPMWSEAPDGVLQVDGPDTLGVGPNYVTVNVQDNTGSLEGARICFIQGEWDEPVMYEVDYTDASGQVQITLTTTDDTDTAALTVWSRNHIPLTLDIPISGTGVTGSDIPALIPFLSIPYPNPVLSSVEFEWAAPEGSGILTIHDIAGRVVVILDNELYGSGTIQWNCITSQGNPVPPGLYFARFCAPGIEPITRQLIILK